MNNYNYENSQHEQPEKKRGGKFWRGIGSFILALFLAVLTVIVINL